MKELELDNEQAQLARRSAGEYSASLWRDPQPRRVVEWVIAQTMVLPAVRIDDTLIEMVKR